MRLSNTIALVCVAPLCVAMMNVEARAQKQSQKSQRPVSQVNLPRDTLPAELNLTGKQLGLPVPDKSIFPLRKEVVSLGRELFFSPRLSRDGSMSCAGCHRPNHGFAATDSLAVGIAGRKGNRHAPTLLNVALGRSFFWDGRARTLEEQSLKPIRNPLEMDHQIDDLLRDLREDAGMIEKFDIAFGSDTTAPGESITSENLATALATFQRTLLSGNSAIDRFRSGDYKALNAQQRQGLWLFESRGGCWRCHSGANFTDENFHNTGIGYGRSERDPGRFAVSKHKRNRFAFKTPTLRDVAITSPYMHDGGMNTLRNVIEFYNVGGATDDPDLDPLMTPLGLSEEEIEQLVAFLKALSSESQKRRNHPNPE